MEQAHSATKSQNTRPLSGTAADRCALNGTWPRDPHVQPSFALEQIVISKRNCGIPSRKDQGDDRISAGETASTDQSNLVGTNTLNAPMIDYRHAPEEQLLAAARSSDGPAFGELSARYAVSVHKRVYRILRNREDTEDVVQEALFKAYAHLGQFRGSCAFSTWLTKIAINSALMLLRKRRSHTEVSFDQTGEDDEIWGVWEFPDPCPDAEQVYAKRQTIEVLSRAVKWLPANYRSVIELYHVEEQSLQESAETLGITVSAAKSRLLRARHTARSILERGRVSMADASY
jgi:RNA polymerase sigma-70 factor (ECF subfamily)